MSAPSRSATIGSLLAAAFVVSLVVSAAGASVQGVTLVSSKRRTLTAAALRAAEAQQSRGRASADLRALTVHGKDVRLVVTTGPENDMLSYRIGGLRNPTVAVDKGASVHLLFVNTDDDMLHDLRLTKQRAPFPEQPDRRLSVGSPRLPHQTKVVRYGREMTFRLAPGAYTYLCTVKGHARAGMFGRLAVR